MVIEPVSQDPSVEEGREKAYYDRVVGYLKFMIAEFDKKIQAASNLGSEAYSLLTNANRNRYESGGKYDPFDQDIIRANTLWSLEHDTIKDNNRRIQKYHEMLEDPYFGRVDYCSPTGKIVHGYVGYADISDYVLDWRNSTAGEMFHNAAHHVAVDDVLIALKREIKTSGQRYGGYTDLINQYHKIGSWHKKGSTEIDKGHSADVISGDMHLVRLLEEYREKKQVHDIVKSIQQNQYKIISEKPERNIVVNGCAGSGKSMVMYHRLSYLGYNHPELMKAERVYAITPSPMFTEDMKPLLHRLDLDEVFNGTFTQLLKKIILVYQRKYGILNPYLFLPYSQHTGDGSQDDISVTVQTITDKIAKTELKQYLLKCFEQAHIFLRDRGFKDFSECKQESDYYNCIAENFRDARFARKLSSEQNVLLSPNDPRRFYGKEVFTDNTFADVETIARRQFEEGSNKKRYKILNDHYRLFQETFSSQPQKSAQGTVTDLWRIFEKEDTIVDLAKLIHIETLVRSAWKCYHEGRFGTESRHLSLYQFYYTAHPSEGPDAFADATIERVCILKYLSEKFGALSSEKTFFFIDEFQNFSPSHIAVLKSVFPNAILNLYGDFDQRISQYGTSSLNELTSLGELTAFEIKENYRNAAEITQYINNVLHKHMMPIGLAGSVAEVSSDQCVYKKDGRTVVIFANRKSLRQFHSNCTNPKSFLLVGDKQQKVNYDKILLLTVGQAKGLEFETVYVHSAEMSDNERYVAFTRALVNLIVVTDPTNFCVEDDCGTSVESLAQPGTHHEKNSITDIALEIQRLLTQYNELCISHREQEALLMKQIIELQNKMLDQ